MSDGWNESADAWIADQGDAGDFGRRWVLDAPMLARVDDGDFQTALDVGCGEGRFCRMLAWRDLDVIGVDPTVRLLEEARKRHPDGDYREGRAESLAFEDNAFDLVVSYLTLIDIPDYRAGIAEMARVLKPGGSLLIANLNGFITACADVAWIRDEAGNRLHYPVDNYLSEMAHRVAWRGIDIINHHRPFSAYMRCLLEEELTLVHFDEPDPLPDAPERAADYRRAPWFHIMEWRKPVL